MKKLIPALAILGSAIAFAVYKLKKEEQKQLAELDEGLLENKEPEFHHEEEKPSFTKEEPVFMKDEEIDIPFKKEAETPSFSPREEQHDDSAMEDIRQLFQETAEHAEASYQAAEEAVKEYAAKAAQAFQEEESYHPEYPHLTNRMVEDIEVMVKEAIEKLAKDGDVHEHERPVQHMVSFRNKEDMEAFKSRVINKGFVITKGENEYDLVVLHISAIDEERLINHILFIADQAYAFNGEYQGWQSKVSF